MEFQPEPLRQQKLGIQWNIEDLNIHCAVADAFHGADGKADTQLEVYVNQDTYISRNSVEVSNRWVIFLKKPHDERYFKVGVKREVFDFHEGVECEVPFGIMASFRLRFFERQDQPTYNIDSPIFTLKHGDSREWEIPQLNTFLDAQEEGYVAIHVQLEIIPNVLGQSDITEDEEEARTKQEALEVSNDIGTFLPFYDDSDDEDVDVPFSDFAIKVKEGEKTFKVHKCILAARSPVFKQMFENPNSKETTEGTTTIADLSCGAVQHFLSFLYTGELHLSDAWADMEDSGEIVMQLLYAADKYEVGSLKDFCDQILHNFFTPRNAYEMFDLCIRYDLTDASSKIEDFMDENILEILEEKKQAIQHSKEAKKVAATADAASKLNI